MNRLLPMVLFSLASVSAAPAFSQDQPPPGDYEEQHVTYVAEPPGIESPVEQPMRREVPQQAAPVAPPAPPAASASAPEETGPVTMREARIEWSAAVESYVDGHSAGGGWRVRDRRGRGWRLRLLKAREETVRETQPGFYTGIATLKSAGGRAHRLDMEFTVGFSMEGWKVQQYAIKKIDGRPS